MSLQEHPRAWGTAALVLAFATGVGLTLGFKDFYPDLERRYQEGRKRNASMCQAFRRASFLEGGPVRLEDREAMSDRELPETMADGLAGCIGKTPLIRIKSLSEATGRVILAKAEFLNGAGMSPKDRVALNLIEYGEQEGLLVPGRGDTVYEGTVGSTGISLAILARAKGYKAHICMPDDQSKEKSDLLHHLGATVERVPVAPITDPKHFVNLAKTRAREHTLRSTDGSRGFFADQFETEANYKAHFRTTGPEVFIQTEGKVDAFVAGAGTGGTISGVAKYLKEEVQIPGIKIVLADPQGSGLYNKIKQGVHYSPTEREGTRRRRQVDSIVEGVGLNRTTRNFEAGRELIDDAVKVTDEQAAKMARWLVEKDGIFVGSSSAVNCVATVATAMTLPPGSHVVTLLCDSGTRHLSKFWKHIKEMGLEDGEEAENLFSLLGLQAQ